jgi:hypothetical protein
MNGMVSQKENEKKNLNENLLTVGKSFAVNISRYRKMRLLLIDLIFNVRGCMEKNGCVSLENKFVKHVDG